MPLPFAMNLTGQRFGAWTVGERAPNKPGPRTAFHCVCDCGTAAIVASCHLRSGASTSCGCRRDWNRLGNSRRVHGASETSEYRIWSLMKGRCLRTTDARWDDYGGRGIRICERWRDSFSAFLADMGPRPSPQHSIDRIDNDGHYEPGNCRWATPKQQGRNNRHNHVIEIDGEHMCIAEAVERYGGNYGTVKWRINAKGMTAEKALGL